MGWLESISLFCIGWICHWLYVEWINRRDDDDNLDDDTQNYNYG